jgi:hypothetical protein
MSTELTMESAAKIMDLKIRPGEPEDLTIAQLILQRADLLAALESSVSLLDHISRNLTQCQMDSMSGNLADVKNFRSLIQSVKGGK